jgi:hypothetical protein
VIQPPNDPALLIVATIPYAHSLIGGHVCIKALDPLESAFAYLEAAAIPDNRESAFRTREKWPLSIAPNSITADGMKKELVVPELAIASPELKIGWR